MKLIIGLGNPGKEYERTRHNIGFEVVDALSEQWNIPLNQAKHKGLYGVGYVDGKKVILLKPMTYMNLSGESIKAVMDYFKVEIEDLVVFYDDLDLAVGKIRLRQKGGAGGHNGIKSMIAHLGTQEFKEEEWAEMQSVIASCSRACEDFLKKPFLQVMNEHN